MIRRLQWNDFNDLVSGYYSYYEEVKENPDLGIIFYDEIPTMRNEVDWFQNLYKDVLNGNAVAMVLEEEGQAVGLCDVRRLRPGSEVSHTGVLGIVIRKDYRGQGSGQQLVKAVVDQCRDKFEMLVLSVFNKNERAKHIYRKIGFEVIGILPNSVKRGERYYDELQMYYKLE